MRALGVGVIGYGFMGRTRVYAHRTIPSYYTPEPIPCRLVAVCEASAGKAEAARIAGGFERACADPRRLIDADDVDLVHVCTPNQLHADALAAAIAAGKHVCVDKPLTATVAEAERIAALLQGYRGIGQVVLPYRFFPATLRARRLVEEGFLGPVTAFRGMHLHSGGEDPAKPAGWKATAAAGGGVINDLGPHILDLIDWLAGPIAAVHCAGRIGSPRRPDPERPGETVAIDAEEAAVMLVRARDGALGTAEVSKIATGSEDRLVVEIHGRDGALRFDQACPDVLEAFDRRRPDGPLGGERGWQRLATGHRYPPPGGDFPGARFAVGWLRGHVHCLYELLAAIAAGRAARPDLADGVRLQRILGSAHESAARGAWVEMEARRP